MEAAKFMVDTNSEFADWTVDLNEATGKNAFAEGNVNTAGCYWNMQDHNL